MKSIEEKAINVCIDIYNDFSEEEIEDHTPSIKRAWMIGSEAEAKKLFPAQDFK